MAAASPGSSEKLTISAYRGTPALTRMFQISLAGLGVPALTVSVFALSAGLAGLAGAIDILGVYGNVRADWNPAYGMAVIPVVFLARMNGWAAITFVFLFSILSIGGESAARRLGVPQDFTLVFVAIVLIVLALAEYYTQRASLRSQTVKA